MLCYPCPLCAGHSNGLAPPRGIRAAGEQLGCCCSHVYAEARSSKVQTMGFSRVSTIPSVVRRETNSCGSIQAKKCSPAACISASHSRLRAESSIVVRVMLELSLRILGQGNACMTSSIRPHAAQEEAVSCTPFQFTYCHWLTGS